MDLNGDGKPDLVLYGYGPLSVMLNDGSGHFSAPTVLSVPFPGTSVDVITLGDFNNDDSPDIAACELNWNSKPAVLQLAVYLNNRHGQFDRVQTIPVPACMGVGAGDANRDGKTDVVLAYSTGWSSTLNNVITTYFGDGSGHFNSSVTQSNLVLDQQQQSYGNPCHLGATGAADFDGDGILDLVLFAGCEGTTVTQGTVYFGQGDGTGHYLLTKIAEGVGGDGVPEIRDVNRDGKPDLICFQRVSGPNATTSTALSFGINNDQTGFQFMFVDSGTTQGGYGRGILAGTAADFSHQAMFDAVVGFYTQRSDGLIGEGISIQQQQANDSFIEIQRWETPGDPASIAAADFDGDGRQDIAVIILKSGHTDLLVYLNKGK